MAQVIKTTFQLRRGLLETWEKNNPILAKGEPSFVVDKNALKIGDGVTPWKELEYIGLNQAGDDYVLTDADKAEIAGIAAGMVEVPEVNTVPSDWNASEGGPGHVLNRTHWEETKILDVPIVGKWVSPSSFEFSFPFLEIGKKYIVKWHDGVEYEDVAHEVNDEFGYRIVIGDEGNGYPFNICQYPSGYTSLSGGAGEFSIKVEQTTIVPLPTKFLPNGVPHVEDRTTILSERQMTHLEDNGTFTITENVPNLVIGETYYVNWNGIEYACIAYDLSELIPNAVALGSASSSNPDPTGNKPFFIFNIEDNGLVAMTIIPHDGTTELTISIYHKIKTIYRLDAELLPAGVPYLKENVLLKESEASSVTHPTFGQMWAIYGGTPDLKVGETYTITYNGMPYKCICQSAPVGLIKDPNAVAMGNFSVVGGENTGEPFAMLVSYLYQEVNIIDLVGSSAVSVKISTEIINKLDEKLLPDGIGGINVTGAKVGQMVKISAVDENGKPTAWEPVPWGYTEGGIVEILPETQLLIYDNDLPETYITTPFSLTIGETYSVNLSGVEYQCNCFDGGDYNETYSGTPSLVNEGVDLVTGEGFIFAVLCLPEPTQGVYGVVMFANKPTEATISIYQDNTVIHPIPGEFLPDGVPYVESDLVEIFPETDMIEFTHPTFGKMWGYTAKAPALTVGETYTVIYNGVPYDCVCHPGEDTGVSIANGAFALGNFAAVGGEDTGEPFAMLIFPSVPQIAIIDLSGATSVRVGITVNGETVHKLNNRCLDLAWLPTVVLTKGEVLVPEQIPNKAGYFSNANFAALNPDITNLLITVNGVEHLCSATVEELTSASDGDYIVMQCATPVGPFLMEYRPNNVAETYAYIGISSGASPTVSVYIAEQEANRMPEEFLPEGVPYVESDMVEMPFVGEWLEIDEGQFGLMSQPIGLEVDKTYIVNCDGIDYEVAAVDVSALTGGEITGVFMGNLAMFGGEDNGMPFMIMELPVENAAIIAHIDGTTEHSFAIYQKSEIIHKLEGKYLPNGTPYIENEGVTKTILEETTISIQYGESISMLNTIIPLNIGQTYIVNFNGDEYVCTASLYANGAICIGSSASFGIQGNNEPFALFYSSGVSFIACDYTIYSEVTLSVKKDITSIHKLDPRCLELDFDWIPYLNAIRGEEVFAERTAGPGLYGYSFGSSTPYYFTPNEYYLIEWNHKPYVVKYIAEEEKDLQTLYGSFTTKDFVIQNVYDGTEAHGLRIRLECRSLNDTPTDVTLAIYKLHTDNKLPNAFLNLDWLPTHEKRNHLLSQISSYESSSLDHEDIYKLRVSGRFNLAKDTKYRMSWGENSYEVVGKDILYNDKKWDCVGNLSLLESSYEDTREPFLLIKEPDLLTAEIYVFMKTQSLPGPYLPFIYDNEIIYNKLPKEYLPDEVIKTPNNATAGDLLMFDGTNWVKYSKADLIAEIIAALPNAEEA